MDIVFFLSGLAFLVLGARFLVKGASALALSLGISPLVVGLTVVAYGTSAPEVAVSVGAVLGGQNDIAIGNVVGSNIFNILLILGMSALITPLVVNRQLVRQEVPIMIAVSAVLIIMLRDRVVGLTEAALLLALLVGYTAFLVIQSRRANHGAPSRAQSEAADAGASETGGSRVAQLAMIIGGLVALVVGSRLLVAAAVSFAKALGVSDLVVGLTIVAAGTSLPEVATSITAAIKGDRDIAVGNVVGSSTFNILGCLGLSGLAAGSAGITVAPSILAFDAWVMLATAIACLPIFLTGLRIARWEGAVFLAYYVFYVGYLILAAEQHDALDTYVRAMTTFVVPLTLLTAGVIYAGVRKGRRA